MDQLKELEADLVQGARRAALDMISLHRAKLVKVAVLLDETDDKEAAHRVRFALLALDNAGDAVNVDG